MILRAGDRAPVLEASPVFGLRVRTPPVRGDGCVLLFVPDLDTGAGRRCVEETHGRLAALHLADLSVVLVTRSPLPVGRDFVPRHHVLFPVVCDGTGEWFGAWGLDPGPARQGGLAGLVSAVQDAVAARLRGVGGRSVAGGGAFVVGSDGTVRFAEVTPSAPAPSVLEALWKAAGVPPSSPGAP